MTDKELLELAAKAAKIPIKEGRLVWGHRDDPCSATGFFQLTEDRYNYVNERRFWNPLQDDGDALRLAVKTGLVVDMHGEWSRCGFPFEEWKSGERHEGDPYAATRRAIVHAAAEIGRAMP